MEGHPRLAGYLQKCHEYFKGRNNAIVRDRSGTEWRRLVQGWGVEKGKRLEDFIGVGSFVGGIVAYALWRMVRQSYLR